MPVLRKIRLLIKEHCRTFVDQESPEGSGILAGGERVPRSGTRATGGECVECFLPRRGQGIVVKKGDVLRVECKPDTNGKIPEGDGTAWSRGRWASLMLAPAN